MKLKATPQRQYHLGIYDETKKANHWLALMLVKSLLAWNKHFNH